MEPLCAPNKYHVFTGIQREDLEHAAELQEKARWFPHEIQLHDDVRNWETMSDREQHFIKYILSFSVVSDGLVNCNLLDSFLQEITDPSARRFYLFQAVMEEVHARTYGLMLTAVVRDKKELNILLNPEENIPSIQRKIHWIEKWITSDQPFGQRVVAFIIVEGLFFSSLFCSFYWLKHKASKLPGMIQANEFIARDEGTHCSFNALILHHVKNKPSHETVKSMMRDAVEIEQNFVKDALQEDLLGMNSRSMCEYVEFIADRTMQMITLGDDSYGEPIYNTKNPFPWMETISLQNKPNFFEKHATEYQDPRVGRSEVENSFGADEDF